MPSNQNEAKENRVAQPEKADRQFSQSEPSGGLWRHLLENIGHPMGLYEPDGKLIFMNRSGAAFLGGRSEDYVGRNLRDFIPENADEYLRRIRQTFDDDALQEYDDCVVLPGGSRWFRSTYQPVADEHGAKFGVQIISQDVTERLHAKRELKERNLELQLAQHIARTGNWTFDPEIGTLQWSDVIYEIYERDPALEPPSLEECKTLYAGEHLERFWTAIQAAIHAGTPYDIEFELCLPGGTSKWIHALCEPSPNKGPKGHILRDTIQDITARKQTSIVLEQTKRDLDQAVRSANVGLWDWDIRSNRIRYSAVWKRQIGYAEDEIGDAFEEWQSRVHPDDLAKALADVREMLDTGAERYELVFRLRHKDGHYRWILAQAGVHKDDAGHPIRAIGSHIDITDHKQLEQERIRLEAVAESSRDFVGITDLDGKALYLNPAGRQLVGLNDQTQVEQTCISDYLWPDDCPSGLAGVAEVLENGHLSREIRFRHFVSGQAIDMQWDVFRVDDPATGEPLFLGTVSRDITERKLAEKATAKLKDQLQSLWNIARHTEATYQELCDLVTAEIQRMTGSRFAFFGFVDEGQGEMIVPSWPTELLSSCIVADMPKRFPLHRAGLWAQAVVDRKPYLVNDLSLEHTGKRGLPIGHVPLTNLLSVPTLRQGKVVALSALSNKQGDYAEDDAEMVHAFTSGILAFLEKKRAEEALQTIQWMLEKKPAQARARPDQAYGDLSELNTQRVILDAVGADILHDIVNDYMTLLETSSAIYEKDGDYALGLFASGWCQRMDQASRRLCGDQDNAAALASGRWLCHESCWEVSKAAMETGAPTDMACHGGIRLYAVPIRAGSDIVGAINFGYGSPPTDHEALQRVGERYRIPVSELATLAGQYQQRPSFILAEAKSRLATSARLIGEMVARRQTEAQLARAREEAESASRAKSEFLANMSHEIRTPLNGVQGFLQLLDLCDLEPEAADYVNTAKQSSQNLLKLINDILDFSKVEAGKLSMEHELFALPALVRSVINTFGPQVAAKGIVLHAELDPSVEALVVGDEARLRQVLFNLVGNAVKFTDQGSVRIDVRALEQSGPDRLRLGFRITDTGIGIPEDKIGALFEPFTQVDGSVTRRFQGTGLGLSIVKRLVKLMGGAVGVESAPGRGTTVEFDIWVGLTDADDSVSLAQPREATSKREVGTGPLRILVAEDDPTNATMIERILAKWGHAVIPAADGKQALEALRGNDVDLVLMDIQMPIMSGLEALSILRHDPDYAHKSKVPVIALTANALKGDEQRLLDAGMDGYVAKPVDIETLREALNQVLARRNKER